MEKLLAIMTHTMRCDTKRSEYSFPPFPDAERSTSRMEALETLECSEIQNGRMNRLKIYGGTVPVLCINSMSCAAVESPSGVNVKDKAVGVRLRGGPDERHLWLCTKRQPTVDGATRSYGRYVLWSTSTTPNEKAKALTELIRVVDWHVTIRNF